MDDLHYQVKERRKKDHHAYMTWSIPFQIIPTKNETKTAPTPPNVILPFPVAAFVTPGSELSLPRAPVAVPVLVEPVLVVVVGVLVVMEVIVVRSRVVVGRGSVNVVCERVDDVGGTVQSVRGGPVAGLAVAQTAATSANKEKSSQPSALSL